MYGIEVALRTCSHETWVYSRLPTSSIRYTVAFAHGPLHPTHWLPVIISLVLRFPGYHLDALASLSPFGNCNIVALVCRAVNWRRAVSYKRASPLPA